MATFKERMLPLVDRLLGIPHREFGLNGTSVTAVVRTWSGTRIGQGTATVTETPLTFVGGYRPRVTEVSTKDVAASGGLYKAGDLRIGPLVPQYTGGGIAPATLDPAYVGRAEVLFRLDGDPYPSDGAMCARVRDELEGEFTWYVVVRRTGQRL